MRGKDAAGGHKGEDGAALRRSIGEVVEVLQSEDLGLRERALRAFHAELLPEVQERVVRALMRALDGKNEEKSHAAAITLSEIGAPAVDALSAAFLSSRVAGRRRRRLIRVLTVISLAHHVVPFVAINRALADPDTTVRLVALKGMWIAAENRNRAFAATGAAVAGDEREP